MLNKNNFSIGKARTKRDHGEIHAFGRVHDHTRTVLLSLTGIWPLPLRVRPQRPKNFRLSMERSRSMTSCHS